MSCPARYHEGELLVQRRAGTEDLQAPWSRAVERTMSEKVMARVATADLAVIAALEDDGHPWAWPLAGPSGLLRPLGAGLLRVHPPAPVPLELAWQIARMPAVGVLSLDLKRRLRARVNGHAVLTGDRLAVGVEEAFTNCPKYIQSRAGTHVPHARPELVANGGRLDREQLALVAAADTLFIATRSADGRLDASHRGGPPGFVTATAGVLSFPDYAGNGMFQSLGNLAEDPRACLLFLDFETGRWLQVLVEAALRFDAQPAGRVVSDRRVEGRIVAVFAGSGLRRCWTLVERSRSLPGAARA